MRHLASGWNCSSIAASLCRALAVLALAAPVAASSEDDPPQWDSRTVALDVVITMKNGSTFQGLVVNSAANQELFPGEAAPDLTAIGRRSVRLDRFNGLSGSITLNLADCRSIEVMNALDSDTMGNRSRDSAVAREERWKREHERLRRVNEARQARLLSAADEMAAGEDEEALPPSLQSWIDRFPPPEGWVPAKKAQLYYQQYVLDTHRPDDQEQEWLDHYAEWKVAYDAWLELEKKKQAAAEEAGEELPSGSDLSGTATSGAAGVDPDDPSKAEQKHLPPPVEDDVPKPEPIPGNAPKPVGAGG